MVRGLRGLDPFWGDGSGDVVEVAPPFDPSGGTALVGATMMFEMLCLLADAVARRKGVGPAVFGTCPGDRPAKPAKMVSGTILRGCIN